MFHKLIYATTCFGAYNSDIHLIPLLFDNSISPPDEIFFLSFFFILHQIDTKRGRTDSRRCRFQRARVTEYSNLLNESPSLLSGLAQRATTRSLRSFCRRWRGIMSILMAAIYTRNLRSARCRWENRIRVDR